MVIKKGHGQFLLLQNNIVSIRHVISKLVTENFKLLLAYNPSIP